MDYFKHVYEGVEYEFKPNRTSQAEVDKMRREIANEIDPELNKRLPELMMRAEEVRKELEKKTAQEEAAKTDKEKEQFEKELKPLIQETMEIQVEMKPLTDAIQTAEVYENVMKLLLVHAKNPDGTAKYKDLTDEKFNRILDSIETEYGLEQYFEICEAITEDVFTMSGEAEKAEPPKTSEFLKNRKNRKRL